MNESQGIIVRDACVGDAKKIKELLDNQFYLQQTLDCSRNALSDFISRKDYHVVVAAREDAPGKVLGVATCIVYQRVRGGFVAVVEDVAVDIECRRKGVGSRLMKEIIERCALQGVFKLFLESSIMAEQFYTELGFTKGGSTMKLFYD